MKISVLCVIGTFVKTLHYIMLQREQYFDGTKWFTLCAAVAMFIVADSNTCAFSKQTIS